MTDKNDIDKLLKNLNQDLQENFPAKNYNFFKQHQQLITKNALEGTSDINATRPSTFSLSPLFLKSQLAICLLVILVLFFRSTPNQLEISANLPPSKIGDLGDEDEITTAFLEQFAVESEDQISDFNETEDLINGLITNTETNEENIDESEEYFS